MNDNHEFRLVITPFCNYKCFFCHNEGSVKEDLSFWLSPKDYAFVARVGKELWGWDTITITGGEPLVSPIYREVCELIAKEGVKITTVTNASLVSSPKKILTHNSQINVSLHTMNPDIYKTITNSLYSLENVLNTLIGIRAHFPDMAIHLNHAVIRNINNSMYEMERVIKFATKINAEAKFIDLASSKQELVVPFEEIEQSLMLLGFEKINSNKWQSFFVRGEDRAIVTRCGFSERNSDLGHRNLFLTPDGKVKNDTDNPIDLLREIHSRDSDAFAEKVEYYFPPAKRI